MSASPTGTRAAFLNLLRQRILVLDGAMGTMIQGLKLNEEGYRGARFDAWNREVRGNNDLLNLSRPDAVRDIHLAYFRAGADIVSTNTFSSTAIAQADYGMEGIAYELNQAGATLAREAATRAEGEDGRRRFVAGALGPTNRTASISPDVANPGFRAITFDQLRAAYGEQVRGLIDGGADLLLIETIFDTLNAKAAIFAIAEICEERGVDVPVMISGTITDRSGRLLSGQTPGAFWNSVKHASPVTIGLNCSFGAAQLRPHLAALSTLADTLIMAYPNAGLPNTPFGLANCGLLNRLKISRRSSDITRPNLVFLISDASTLNCPGPRTEFRPVAPNVPVVSATCAKHAVLNHWPMVASLFTGSQIVFGRLLVMPVESMLCVWVMVIGRPLRA